MEPYPYLRLLIDSLFNLASSPDDQLLFLKRVGIPGCIDDLALEFSDRVVVAKQKYEEGEINERQYNLMIEIDKKLDAISGKENAYFWEEDGLRNSKEWEEIRKLSKDCLILFKVTQNASDKSQNS